MNSFKIDEIIRYALAGGVTLLSLYLGYQEPSIWLTDKKEGSLVLAIFFSVPVLIGAVAYILHRALFYPAIYKILSKVTKRGSSLIELDLNRWKNQNKPKALQPKLSEWAAQIHFLYASTWSMTLADFCAKYAELTQTKFHEISTSIQIIFIVSAIIHHYRYMLAEKLVFINDDKLAD